MNDKPYIGYRGYWGPADDFRDNPKERSGWWLVGAVILFAILMRAL